MRKVIVAFFCLFLVACNEGEDGSGTPPPVIPPPGVEDGNWDESNWDELEWQ